MSGACKGERRSPNEYRQVHADWVRARVRYRQNKTKQNKINLRTSWIFETKQK